MRPKNLLNSEILKITSNFAKKLKTPLLIIIESSAADTEILYEIIEGQLRASSDVSEYVKDFFEYKMLRDEALSVAIKKNCALCLRIASIVDENYETNVEVEGDDGKCDIDCVRALIKAPIDDKLEEVTESAFKVFHGLFIENLKDEENFSMPLESLASVAWKQKEFKIFNFLIRSDFPFPQNFIKNREKVSTKNKFHARVENYIEEVEKFHLNIKAGNYEEVKGFLEAHKLLRFVRNLENKTALKTAIDANQLEIVSLLKSRGMLVGSSEEVYEGEKALKQARTKIRQFNHDQLANIEDNYISKLMHQTSIFHNPRTQKIEDLVKYVKDAYLKVNQSFPEILELVSKSKSVEIIFNFQSNQVGDYYPTGEEKCFCPYTLSILLAY